MKEHVRRWHSPTTCALICLAFFLPFANVSCNGAQTEFTGADLVVRTVPEGGDIDGEPLADRVEDEASWFATGAFASAVAGLLLGIAGAAKGTGAWCTIGLGSMLVLLLESFQPLGPEVRLLAGFWLAFALYLWLAGLHLSRVVRRRQRPAFPDPQRRPASHLLYPPVRLPTHRW